MIVVREPRLLFISVFFAIFLYSGTSNALQLNLSSKNTDAVNYNIYISYLNNDLISAVPSILIKQDVSSGRFYYKNEKFNLKNQNLIYSLAVVWSFSSKSNPYYQSKELLNTIVRGGNALIDAQDITGRFDLLGLDGEVWGKISDPWIYMNWIRTYEIIKHNLSVEDKLKWQNALEKGFRFISKVNLRLAKPNNISITQAVALYIAGMSLNRPEWSVQGKKFVDNTLKVQSLAGFWSENSGPVVSYNFRYVQALGIYYGINKDAQVLQALERAAIFHSMFVYPDRSLVETVDERNYYTGRIDRGNVGFLFTKTGRGYLYKQYSTTGFISFLSIAEIISYADKVSTNDACNIHYVNAGTTLAIDSKSLIQNIKPWFVVLSAYTSPQSESRWILDRQNFISVFHDKKGLLLGGGNTKLQPLWSTFTVGSTDLLSPVKGKSPNFIAPDSLKHTPDRANLFVDRVGVALGYGVEDCSVVVKIIDDQSIVIEYSRHKGVSSEVSAHIPLIARLSRFISFDEKKYLLSNKSFVLSANSTNSVMNHDGVEYHLPRGSLVTWPVYPYNQYFKDGLADIKDARLVITVPLSNANDKQNIVIKVKD